VEKLRQVPSLRWLIYIEKYCVESLFDSAISTAEMCSNMWVRSVVNEW